MSEFKVGTVVAFDNEGQVQTAVIKEVKGDKLKILTMRGRENDLKGDRISALPEGLPSTLTSDTAKAEFLLNIRDKALAQILEVDVKELWAAVCEEEREFTPQELTETYFGKDTLINNLTLRFAIISDHIFFKRKKFNFIPRPSSTIEELVRAEEIKREHEKNISTAINELKNKQTYSQFTLKILNSIKQVAAGAHLEGGVEKEVIQFLSNFPEMNLKGTHGEQAYDFLTAIGEFTKNTNLAFIRHSLPPDFNKACLEEAENLNKNNLSTEAREDLTHLEVFTIDDETTLDIDDGLSFEVTPEGYRIGIHITDIADLIEKDSLLDQEAKKRATSHYFPEKKVNMFPHLISEDIGSLKPDEVRAALTCFVNFSKSREILSYELKRSIVKSIKKYSYDEVDKLLSPPAGEIGMLYEIAMSYAEMRLEGGGSKVPKRAVKISLLNPEQPETSDFTVSEYNENTPARELVGEMMILCNELTARYAAENKIPFFYRTQEQSDINKVDAISNIPAGPAYEAALRSTLKRSLVTLTPAIHATLGVKTYGQVTSPIRRYLDLINQRQIAAHLKSEPLPYTAEDLDMIMAETSETLQTARLLSRETERLWILRHLHKKSKLKEKITATVIRTEGAQYLVELDEVYIPATLKKSDQLKLGDRVLLTIQTVDPRFDYLKLHLLESIGNN